MSRSPLTERWSGRPDSNRRRPAWEAGGALPRFSPPILFAHFPKSCSNLSTTVCGLLLWLRQNERQKVGRIALSKDTARTLEVFEVLTTRYPQSRRELLSSLCPAICPSGKPVVASRPSIGHGERASSVSVKDPLVSGKQLTLTEVAERLRLGCRKPRRHLYLLTRVGTKLVDYLGLRCHGRAGLRFRSQGRYVRNFTRAFFAPFLKGHRKIAPLPRCPWDPRAVSDPRLIAGELFRLEEEQPKSPV